MKTHDTLFNTFGSWIVAALLAAASVSTVRAAGLLIADGGFGGVLEIKEHQVQVAINNGIAVTHVTQVFHNTENRQVEALYTFPVPNGASVANFSMWINGREMVGEVLEKKRAREIYESYKRTRQDPGLLEQVDFKTFEMRIFPIGPNSDQKVQISYYQELDFDNDWATYVYPLATVSRKDIQQRTAGRFAIAFDIQSAVPIAALESPSHGAEFVVAQHSDHYQQASLETNQGDLARDVVLACQLVRPKTGFDLLTSKRPGEDGYFCLTLTVGDDLAQRDDGMDYLFLLDVSGSMADDGKLLLSKDSIGAFINELGDSDRFEVMAFNVQPNQAFGQMREANAANQQTALDFLSSQRARGGTVLNPALTTAYKYAEADRTLNVVVLSDGLTEQAERQTLLRLIQARPRNARVFCIGVGNDVNRPLLEQLAEEAGGLAAFLSRGDNFARQAKAFRRKLMRPVATDLRIDFNGISVSELEPRVLPNLYHGAPIRLYGRYRDSGTAAVSLRASVQGVELKQSVQIEFPKVDDRNPEIDRMWAWHRVDTLLKQADRSGSRQSALDEIVRLGEAYSIVTEYTSFLVLENDAEYQRWKIARTNTLRLARDRQSQEQLRTQLAVIRDKAVAGLGPTAEEEVATGSPQHLTQNSAPARPSSPSASPGSAPAANPQSRDLNIPVGTGPVGPLLLLFLSSLAWIQRWWKA